jgi:eukaryotic-like serine/threonine-protein kinase
MNAPDLLLKPPGQTSTVAEQSTGKTPRVQVVGPSQPHLTDEISSLLRQRITNAVLMLSLAMFVSLITTLTLPLLTLRIAVLGLIAILGVTLMTRTKFSTFQLRSIEVVMLTALVLQISLMPDALILASVRAGDTVTAIMDLYFVQAVWAVALIFYGLYIPNTWQRATVVILPLACAPAVNFYLLGFHEPLVNQAIATLHHGPPMPIVLLGALGGIFGAHTLHTIRREEFKARQFGQYALKELLGSGGMGEVYRAEHDLLKRPCAIKLIRPGAQIDTVSIARFEREACATAQLTHPSTIEVYDYGKTKEGVFYYVMELLHGMSLQDMVAVTGPMPAARAVYFLRQVAGALAEAHMLGISHRDIKPANIFAARIAGQTDVAKLLDFGLVQFASAPQDTQLTEKGLVCGSPLFMSPEQARASGNIDHRTDIYSLGASAYYLVTGRSPFAGKTKLDIMVALTRDLPIPPSRINPQVPADFEAIIFKCLEKKPEDRFQSILEFLDALEKCDCAHQWTPHWARLWWMKQDQLQHAANQPLGDSEFALPLGAANTLGSDKTLSASDAGLEKAP